MFLAQTDFFQLVQDLNLTNTQYALCLSVFFISYALFEIPSNILLKRLKPHVWLSAIMIAWGLVMTFMGLATTFTGLLVARFFLGLTEAGLYITSLVILSIDSLESNSTSHVGTNAMNSAFVVHCSFRLQLCLGPLVVCLQLRLPKWMELVEKQGGRGLYLLPRRKLINKSFFLREL